MGKKARELNANLHRMTEYKKQDMTGRVSHSQVWERAMKRWKPGMRVTVEFDK